MTIWTAVGAIAVVVGLIVAGVWAFASLRGDITANAVGLKGLEDKHNTFAARVSDDFKRLEAYVKELFSRDREPPARRR
jgi:hypothetical protein